MESVEGALNALGIDNVCYWYTYTDQKVFHPLIANIQLFYLLTSNSILSDNAAAEIAELFPEKDESYYLNLIKNLSFF